MAFISQRGAYWRAGVRRRKYKPVFRSFDTKQQARTWLVASREKDSGAYVAPSEPEHPTLREALDRYRRDIVPEKRHPYQENRRIDRWIRHDLAYRTLASQWGTDFAKYRDNRHSAGRAENTIWLELRIISQLDEIASQRRGMEGMSTPLDSIRKPTGRFVKIQESARHHSLSRVLRAIRAHRKLNTTYYPWIKLAGVWLEDAGFEAGERVRITVEEKRLIITPM